MTLKTRLFVLLTGLALVPLVLALGWQAFDRRANRRTVEEFHAGMADFVASSVSDWHAQVNKRLTFLYGLENSAPKDLAANAFKIFQQATAAGSEILAVALIAPDGTAPVNLQADSGDDRTDPAADPLVAKVRASKTAEFGPLTYAGAEPAVGFAYPLPNGHVVRMVLSLREVWKRLARRRLGDSGRVFLVDADARPLPGQETPKEGVAKSADVFGLGAPDKPLAPRIEPSDLDPQALKAAISGAPRGFLADVPSRAGPLTVSWQRIDGFPWTVLTAQRRSEALSAEESSVRGTALFIVLTLALGLAAATALSRALSKPILGLAEAAKKVAARSYEALPEDGWPEFRALAADFNQMTAKLKSYEALQLGRILEEKAKAETLVSTIPDGVVMTDDSSAVIYGNAKGFSLLGLPEKSSRTPKIFDGLPASSPLRPALERALRSEGPVLAEARVTVSADPFIEKLFRIYSSHFALAASKQKGRVLVIRDATAEAQLETMKNELFLMIAHDMRGSLSIIEGGTDIIRRLPSLPEKATTYVAAIRAAGKTMTGMVNDILNLNKMEAGQLELKLAPMSVNALLAAQCEAHRVPAEMRKLFVTDVPLGTDLSVVADQSLIERVLANLAGNALKFTPSGGRIELSCPKVDADHLCFCVSDNGPGIPEDKREFIFEKYGQLDQGKPHGFGLGLAMCKMAVELHGGRIWVESEMGKGSRFLFTLSRKLAATPAA